MNNKILMNKNVSANTVPCSQKYIKKYQLMSSGPFYWHWLGLISAWISNHMLNEVCGWIYLSICKLQWLHRWSLGMNK